MDDVIKFNGWSIPVKEQHFQQWLFDDMLTNYQEKPFNISVNFCDNFDCAIDIGANIGMMTTRYSNIFSKVIGFEPVDVNFRCLTKNTNLLRFLITIIFNNKRPIGLNGHLSSI